MIYKRGAVAVIFLCAASTWAQGDFEAILSTDFTLVAARRIGDVVDDRWVMVDTRSANRLPPNRGSGWRMSEHSVYSVDCRNRGIENVLTEYNIETDPDKPVRWVGGFKQQGPEKQFHPRDIRHLPVPAFEKREQEELLAAATDETTREDVRKWRVAPLSPSQALATVTYACHQVKEGLSPTAAARRTLRTGGVDNITSLLCVLRPPPDVNAKALEMRVRFDDEQSFVQVQDVWRKDRTVSGDRIWVSLKNSTPLLNDLTISRSTGNVVLRGADSDVRYDGSCEKTNDERKF